MKKFHVYAWAAVISMLIMAGYANSLHSPFVFDDEPNIVRNTAIQVDSLDLPAIWRIITSHQLISSRPVANLSFALNFALTGNSSFGFHIVNVAIHILTSLLLLRLFLFYYRKLVWPERDALLVAVAATALWALNPVQINAVTYLVQRMTSLCALLFLASLLAWLKGREVAESQGSGRHIYPWYGLALLLWLLALFTKEHAAIMPAIIILHECVFYGAFRKRTLIRQQHLLLWGMLVICSIGLLMIAPKLSAMISSGYADRDFTLGQRLLTQPRVIMIYLSLFLLPLPSRLNMFHDIPVSVSLLQPWTTMPSILALLLLIGVALYSIRKYPMAAFGILWMLLCLVIESSVLPLELIFEHRFYLPSMGLSLVITAAVFHLFALFPSGRRCFLLFWVTTCIHLTVLTYSRHKDWRDGVTLYADAASKSPRLIRVVNGLGVEHYRAGNRSAAVQSFETALELDPNNIVVLANFVAFYADFNPARREYYLERLKAAMAAGHFHCNQTMNLNLISRLLARQKRYGDIVALLEPQEKCHARSATYYNSLGISYAWLGDQKQAIEHYSRAVSLDQFNPTFRLNLTRAYIAAGERSEAVKSWKILQDIGVPPDLQDDVINLTPYFKTYHP